MSKNPSRAPRGPQEPPCPLPREPLVQRGGVHMVTQFLQLLVQRSGLDLAIRVTRSARRLGEIYALRRVPLDPHPAVVRGRPTRVPQTVEHGPDHGTLCLLVGPLVVHERGVRGRAAPRAASRKLSASVVLPFTASMPRSFSFQADSSERGAGDPVAGGDQSVAILEPVYPVAPVTSTSIPLLPAAPSDAGAYHGSG